MIARKRFIARRVYVERPVMVFIVFPRTLSVRLERNCVHSFQKEKPSGIAKSAKKLEEK